MTGFGYRKVLCINEQAFFCSPSDLVKWAGLLIHGMDEMNEQKGVYDKFFRLDFRPQTREEELSGNYGPGVLIMDFKWGLSE